MADRPGGGAGVSRPGWRARRAAGGTAREGSREPGRRRLGVEPAGGSAWGHAVNTPSGQHLAPGVWALQPKRPPYPERPPSTGATLS